MGKRKAISISVITLLMAVTPVAAAPANGQGAASRAGVSDPSQPVSSETTVSDDTAAVTTTTDSAATTRAENEIQTQVGNPEVGTMAQDQLEERIQKKIKVSQPEYKPKNAKALEHRSAVANAAEYLVRVAERTENKGIGDQIRTAARTQSQNQDKIGEAIDKAEKRSGAAKFFIGANFKELKTVKQAMIENRAQIKELEEIMAQLETDADKVEVANQIIEFQNQQIELKDQLSELSSGFSLFGWIAKWRNKF